MQADKSIRVKILTIACAIDNMKSYLTSFTNIHIIVLRFEVTSKYVLVHVYLSR